MLLLFIFSCGGGSGGSGGTPTPNISGDLNVQFSGEEGGVRIPEICFRIQSTLN